MSFATRVAGMMAGAVAICGLWQGMAEGGQKPRNDAPQHFVCNLGYIVDECKEQLGVLRAAVEKYPTRALGEWTWVMVKSKDWKGMMAKFGLSPYSPAFTCMEKRVTFVEEALVVRVPERTGELAEKWHMGMRELLEVAVAHEMGHAMCGTVNEDKARRMAGILQRNGTLSCQSDF